MMARGQHIAASHSCQSLTRLPTALTTSELWFSNAKHVFNICSLTLRGNLYQHLLSLYMENRIKLRRSYQRGL